MRGPISSLAGVERHLAAIGRVARLRTTLLVPPAFFLELLIQSLRQVAERAGSLSQGRVFFLQLCDLQSVSFHFVSHDSQVPRIG